MSWGSASGPIPSRQGSAPGRRCDRRGAQRICGRDLPTRVPIGAIEERILNSELIDYALQQFQIGLQKRLDDLQREATGLDELRRERQHLKAKADRLADATAEMGHSPALLEKLGEVDAQIAAVDRRMDDLKPLH